MSKIWEIWTDEENVWLTENYRTVSKADMENRLGRKYETIARRASKMGLTKIRKSRADLWTDEETEKLIELWADNSAASVGRALGKSKNGIIGKAYRLGLPPKRPRPRFNKIDQLRVLAESGKTIMQCSSALKTAPKTIKHHAGLNGIKFKKADKKTIVTTRSPITGAIVKRAFNKPPTIPKNQGVYVKQNGDGGYLHMSQEKIVMDKTYAARLTLSQAKAAIAKSKFDNLHIHREVRV